MPSVRMTPPSLNSLGLGLVSPHSTTIMSGGTSPSDPLAAAPFDESMADLQAAEVNGATDETMRTIAWGGLLFGTLLSAATVFVIYQVFSKG